jgi:hypothetical protein
MDSGETHNDTCHALQAYVVLLFKWRLRSVTVASRRGCTILDAIEPIPGQPTNTSLAGYGGQNGLI